MPSQPSPPTAPPQSVRRRVLGYVVLAVVLSGVVWVGLQWYFSSGTDRALEEALAEADRLDPGWRLEQIEAVRSPVPAKENGALHLLAVHRLIPPSWPDKAELERSLEEAIPQHLLNADQIKLLRTELGKAGKARIEARKLKHLPC